MRAISGSRRSAGLPLSSADFDCAMMPASSIAAISVSSAMAALTSSVLPILFVLPCTTLPKPNRSALHERIVCAQPAQPAISVCTSHMSSRNHKMRRQQTRLAHAQNASCAVANSKIHSPVAICRVYFSHGRSVFTPVPKFVRERVLRYGRRSATDNVSLHANTVEHPLGWGDNAQRTADSTS